MRRILRVARSAMVFSLVFMMTVDTANACRLFQWLSAHRAACSASCAPDIGIQLTACCDAAPSMPIIEASPVIGANCCGCSGGMVADVIVDGGYVDGGYVDGSVIDGGYMDGGYATDSYVEGDVYSGSGEVYGGEVIMDASPVDLAPTDTIVSPMPAADDEPPVPVAPKEPTEEPAPVAANNPLDAAADDAPADDSLFDDGPTDAPIDDAFDAPTDAFDAPADGFDAPADEPAPADAGGDDLFEAAPADDLPTDEGGGDDLFDAAPADDEPADGDDLFDDGDDGDDEDGLFSGRADDVAPVVEETEPNDADDLDNLFSQYRADGMRVWTDNTGTYQTVGRLVVIAKSHVRLLKENGRYSTVPLTRLSSGDLDYVMAVAVKLTGSQRIASR